MQGFADNLRRLRELRGWTQVELGKRCSLSQNSLSGYESGRHKPQIESLVKLAKALRVRMESLIGT